MKNKRQCRYQYFPQKHQVKAETVARPSRLASYKSHSVIPNVMWLAETKMANREDTMNSVRKAREGRPYTHKARFVKHQLETNVCEVR